MQTKPKKHVSIALIALALSITHYSLHAAQASHQADIQWLQHMSRQLEDRKNRAHPGVMRHIVSGIKKKIAHRPELATLPFARQHNQNAAIPQRIMPTAETTLLLRAMEMGYFPAIEAVMEADVSPLAPFNLLEQNSPNRINGLHLGALGVLAAIHSRANAPANQYVDSFIQVIEHVRSAKWDHQQIHEALDESDRLPKDLQGLIVDMLSGSKSDRQHLDEILDFLHWKYNDGKTLHDMLVEHAARYVPTRAHIRNHERGRHRLQMYFLEHGVRLDQQASLHNNVMRRIPRNSALKIAAGGILLGLGMILELASFEANSEWPVWLLGTVSHLYGRKKFLDYLFNKTTAKKTICNLAAFHVARHVLLAKLSHAVDPKLFIVTSAISALSSYLGASELIDGVCLRSTIGNMIKERYLAWKKGITDIWGRKIPERLVDEVGGLE